MNSVYQSTISGKISDNSSPNNDRKRIGDSDNLDKKNFKKTTYFKNKQHILKDISESNSVDVDRQNETHKKVKFLFQKNLLVIVL